MMVQLTEDEITVQIAAGKERQVQKCDETMDFFAQSALSMKQGLD